jgi:hypothetical protein
VFDVIGFEGEPILADLESIPVPQSVLPAEYADYSCSTTLYRGNTRTTLRTDQFIAGRLLI